MTMDKIAGGEHGVDRPKVMYRKTFKSPNCSPWDTTNDRSRPVPLHERIKNVHPQPRELLKSITPPSSRTSRSASATSAGSRTGSKTPENRPTRPAHPRRVRRVPCVQDVPTIRPSSWCALALSTPVPHVRQNQNQPPSAMRSASRMERAMDTDCQAVDQRPDLAWLMAKRWVTAA